MNKRKLTAIFAAAAVAAGLFAVTAPLAASAAEETAPYTQNFDDAEAALADFDTTDRFGTDNQIDFKISGGTLHTETTDKATFGDVVAWTLKKQFKNFKMEVDLQWKGDNGTSTDAVRFGNQVVAIHLRTYNGDKIELIEEEEKVEKTSWTDRIVGVFNSIGERILSFFRK